MIINHQPPIQNIFFGAVSQKIAWSERRCRPIVCVGQSSPHDEPFSPPRELPAVRPRVSPGRQAGGEDQGQRRGPGGQC